MSSCKCEKRNRRKPGRAARWCIMPKQLGKYRRIEWVKEGILPYPRHGSCVYYEPAIICGAGKDMDENRIF